ncbi:MAG: MATE family efflux transporter [Cellulosilyticaceae bacterium]
MYITKDRNFYKLIIGIAIPIGFQNLITFVISMMDTLMLGALGEVPLSAATIANNLFFILTLLMFGLAGGSNVMIAQYWGKGDVKTIHKIMGMMYRCCVVLTCIFVAVAVFLPEEVMGVFTTDTKVILLGASYLRIVAIGYLFYAITNCTIMVLRAVQTVKIAMVVYGVSLVVNTFLNWVFIFGKFGMPAMGVEGAAVATTIARVCEFVVLVVFMCRYEKRLCLKLRDLIRTEKSLMKAYFKNTTPVVFNELLWSVGSTMIGVVVGHLGTQVVAANSINTVIFQLVTVFIFGVGNAAATIIGNTIGEGKLKQTKEYADTILVFSVLLGFMAAGVTYVISPMMINLYNVTQETKMIAMEIAKVTAFIVIFKALAVNALVGILRGGGDTQFVFINDLIFMWLVAVPFGFMAAFWWELSIPMIFLILRSDEILKVISSLIRIKSGKWIKDVTVATMDVK